mgnify:CR=1 FL=1
MIDDDLSSIAEFVFRGFKLKETILEKERKSIFLEIFFQINSRAPLLLDVSMDLEHYAILLQASQTPVLGIKIERGAVINFFPFGKMTYEDWSRMYLSRIWMQKAIGCCLLVMQLHGEIEQLPLD